VGGFLGALLTGVFASWVLWNNANGNVPEKAVGALTAAWPAGLTGQLWAQLVAALVAAGYAFGATVVLVKVIDAVWGFSVDARDEAEGLDVTQHGEVGFDVGGATLEEVPEIHPPEPRPARVPPDGLGRFTVVVEGPPREELLHAWSGLCQASSTPVSPDFRAVYDHVTTVQGNRFRFRGGDRSLMREHLQRLFQDVLGTAVRAHVEE
jgi:hypothetical protein